MRLDGMQRGGVLPPAVGFIRAGKEFR